MLYGVVFEMQKDEIANLCLGRCGHGIMGIMDLPMPELGEDAGCTIMPCRKDMCPYLVKQMDRPIGTVQGEAVYLRNISESAGDKVV